MTADKSYEAHERAIKMIVSHLNKAVDEYATCKDSAWTHQDFLDDWRECTVNNANHLYGCLIDILFEAGVNV